MWNEFYRIHRESYVSKKIIEPPTSQNHGEVASKKRRVRFTKTMHHAARSNERGACTRWCMEIRIIPHKYAPINAATFVIYGRVSDVT